MIRCIFLALLSLAAAHPAPARSAEPVLADFPPGQDACFGRIYDEGHLNAHPRQTVRELYLYRSLEADPQTEELPLPPAEIAQKNLEMEAETRRNSGDGGKPGRGRTTLELLVRTKQHREMLKQSVECWPDGGGRFHCGVECDGGGFEAAKEGQALKLKIANSGGLRVQSGCSGGDESAPEVRIGEDRAGDDLAFRLEPLPPASCLSARNASRPPWVAKGPPLRHHFAQNRRTCYLLRKGGSNATTQGHRELRSLELIIDADSDEEGGGISLDAHLSARTATRSVRKSLQCQAFEYEFSCSADIGAGMKLYRDGASGLVMADLSFAGGEIAQLFGETAGKRYGPFALEESSLKSCER